MGPPQSQSRMRRAFSNAQLTITSTLGFGRNPSRNNLARISMVKNNFFQFNLKIAGENSSFMASPRVSCDPAALANMTSVGMPGCNSESESTPKRGLRYVLLSKYPSLVSSVTSALDSLRLHSIELELLGETHPCEDRHTASLIRKRNRLAQELHPISTCSFHHWLFASFNRKSYTTWSLIEWKNSRAVCPIFGVQCSPVSLLFQLLPRSPTRSSAHQFFSCPWSVLLLLKLCPLSFFLLFFFHVFFRSFHFDSSLLSPPPMLCIIFYLLQEVFSFRSFPLPPHQHFPVFAPVFQPISCLSLLITLPKITCTSFLSVPSVVICKCTGGFWQQLHDFVFYS